MGEFSLRKMLKDRWLGLCLGMWMQACGGISYVFSLYSADLKQTMGYNQEMIDGLGTAKDIGGNVGIISGLLIDVTSAWFVLFVGGIMHFLFYTLLGVLDATLALSVGRVLDILSQVPYLWIVTSIILSFGLIGPYEAHVYQRLQDADRGSCSRSTHLPLSSKNLYLAATGQISPSHLQMCIIIMLGTNGATWFNTAVLITCMRNFPSDRGVVVGLLKGFIGLSGAIFTQVYTAVYAPTTGPFLLFCAIVPPLVAFASMLVIQPVDGHKQKDEGDKLKFKILYVVGLVLALYLMAVILIQDFFVISKAGSRFFMAVMLVILLLPAIIPWRWGTAQQTRGYYKLAIDVPISYSPTTMHTPTKHHHMEPLLVAKTSTAVDVMNKSNDVQNGAPKAGLAETPSKLKARLGQDHTLFQAAKTQDYWLLFFAMGCGTGSGLTAINNLAQMAESLGSRSIGAFVALVSVWNFLGRMGAGYISEHCMKRHATPRPLFLFMVQLVMASAHLLFASSVPTLLYLASVLVGLAHGAHWTLMVATSSELFGLQHFGALYNTLSISSTVGSYILSVKLAGYLYDRQVAAAEALALAAGQDAGSSHKCAGPDCFRSTFLVMACVCGVGCIALLRLVSRTKKVYRDMYKNQQDRDALKESELSSDDSLPLLSKDLNNGEAIRTDSPIYKASTLSDAHLRHHAPSRTE